MARLLIAAMSLLLPFVAGAETVVLAHIGDPQEGTRCTNASTAWPYWSAAVQHVADLGPSVVSLAVFPGDLTNGRGNCWCWAQPGDPDPDVATCDDTYTNPYTGVVCTKCGSVAAAACTGGTPGWWCEWERIKTATGLLTAADVGWSQVVGNRDDDVPVGFGGLGYSDYNAYFGSISQLSTATNILDQGIFQASPLALAPEMPMSSYQVFETPGGAQFLHIALSYIMGRAAELETWAFSVMDLYPKMPTILTTHYTVSPTCSLARWEAAWCELDAEKGGSRIFDILAAQRSQVFLVLGGHIRTVKHVMTTTPSGYPLIGMAADYSLDGPITGAPTWQSEDNGGGGVVTWITINTTSGVVSALAVSPQARADDDAEGAFVTIHDIEGDTSMASLWTETVPLCAATDRFTFPAGACVEPPTLPKKCCQ